jgi:hypothetical protein
MSYAEFQADWEQAARAEYESYLRLPTATLLAEVRARRYGEYYQLWRAIAARATLADAGHVLLSVVRGENPYLVRYHAAGALLLLLGTKKFEQVELAAERPGRVANIDAVERMLRDRLTAGVSSPQT